MSDDPLTYIVIVNYDGCADTKECLLSLAKLASSSFRAIVVDNGSTDGSAAELDRWLSLHGSTAAHGGWIGLQGEDSGYDVMLVRNHRNLGFAGGCNVGIQLALEDPRCAYVWLLNNDTVVTPNALTALLGRCALDRRIGLCGSTLVYHHLGDVVQACGGCFAIERARGWQIGNMTKLAELPETGTVEPILDYVVGASMLASREFVEGVGLLDERYFLYFEELDWAVRGGAVGFTQAWARDSIVFHKEGASIGSSTTGRPSGKSVRFMTSSYLRFVKQHRPGLLPKAVVTIVARIGKAALLADVARSKAALRGLICFMKNPSRYHNG